MSERDSRRRPRRLAPIVVHDRQNRTAALRSASPFPQIDRDSIVVMSVGGIGSNGSNWTLYGAADRRILVDAGAGMPPKGVAGLQVVVPDPAQLEPIFDRLVAIVVTHAHYDHIGGLPALVPYLRKGTRIGFLSEWHFVDATVPVLQLSTEAGAHLRRRERPARTRSNIFGLAALGDPSTAGRDEPEHFFVSSRIWTAIGAPRAGPVRCIPPNGPEASSTSVDPRSGSV